MIYRHEINILNGSLVNTSTSVAATSSEIVVEDCTKFSGTLTVYLEVLATNTSTNSCTVNVPSGATNPVSVSASTPVLTLFRSAGYSPSGSALTTAFSTNLAIGALGSAGTVTVKAARIVIIQDTSTSDIIASECQFEIGTKETGLISTTAGTALTRKAYWKYDASSWDGTVTFLAEAVYNTVSTNTITIVLQESSADLTAPTWTTKITIVSAATGTTVTKSARVAFTPTDGRMYRIAYNNNSTMNGCAVYNAKVVVQQSGANIAFQTATSTGGAKTANGTDSFGQTFTALSSGLIGSIGLQLKGLSTPIGSVYIKIYDSSFTTLLGTSNVIDASTISTTTLGPIQLFTFNPAPEVVLGTVYAIAFVFDRTSGSGSVLAYGLNTNPYADGASYDYISGVWGTSTFDLTFTVSGVITKLEEQYLLANTTLSAGTALQNFLTKWDFTEWSGITNTYVHQVEATDANTSVVEIDTAAGVQVSGSVVSSPDNIGQSASMTMPSSTNLDVKATTNSGNIYASRILVRAVKTAVTTTTTTTVPFSGIIYQLMMLGVG